MLVLGLTLSGLAIADYFGAAVPIVAYAAVSLLVIGLTFIAATRFGRPCGPAPTGCPADRGRAGPSRRSDRNRSACPTPPLPASRVTYDSVAKPRPTGDALDFGTLEVVFSVSSS